ncbi:hypothetical protein ACJJJB_21140 [Microbulbifer sp. ANSA001]|uniref:hypothetical protein n=1 Tax=Microbulbifer sp. ANSA001 TaxID=3243358 RepID=UPI0040424A53
MTVENAEKRALEALSLIAQGANPNEQRNKNEKLKMTFIEVYKSVKDLSNKSLIGYDQCINAYVKDWHDKPLV